MGGKHRKKVPVARRLFLFGLCTTAVVTLLIAWFSQPVAVSSSAKTPDPPLANVDSSTNPTTTTTSPPAKTKIKKPRRSSQTASPKIKQALAVTPEDHPTIKLPRTTDPRPRQDPVRSTTPTGGKAWTSAPSPVVERQSTTIPHTDSHNSDTNPDTTTKSKPTPRVAPSSPFRVSPTPRPNPTTVVPEIPTIPSVTTNSKCGTIGLLPGPRAACNLILAAFPEVQTVLGVGSRAGNPTSCHPKGLAIDLMVGSNKALGDRLYAYVIAHRTMLGATPVVLWQVPDHYDHVHISFDPCKG